MKKIYSILVILFVVMSLNANAQDIYYKYKSPDSEGKQLVVEGTDLLSYYKDDSTHSGFNANLHAEYTQWKFNRTWLTGGIAHLEENFSSSKNGSSTTFSRNQLSLEVFGGASYYFTPDKFYGTIATFMSYATESHDTGSTASGSISTNSGPGYLYGALGYGRVYNAGRISVAMDFAERLKESGFLKGTLSQSTILALTNLVDKQAYGDFSSKYWDEGNPMFFKQVETLLINDGVISNPLDAANTVRLYETISNTYGRYVFYPRYTGYQVQVQAQYQLFNSTKDKPHDHYASISGVYGVPVGPKTGLVFSSYFALPLDTLASGFGPSNGFATGGASTFLTFLPDQNNLGFFNGNYSSFGSRQFNNGTGFFTGAFASGNTTQIGIRADVYHSISSKAGIQAFLQFQDFMPKVGDAATAYEFFGRMDYNLTNYLLSYLYADYSKFNVGGSGTSPDGRVRFGVGLSARIF
ncbi:hypothetical protein BH10BAC5_BH10BAC5_08170 [soil metagenome]